MERRLKQIHAEMLALRNKETSGIKLSREERFQPRQLAGEHDSLAFDLPPTPNSSRKISFTIVMSKRLAYQPTWRNVPRKLFPAIRVRSRLAYRLVA
jgi:hypothetical protein